MVELGGFPPLAGGSRKRGEELLESISRAGRRRRRKRGRLLPCKRESSREEKKKEEEKSCLGRTKRPEDQETEEKTTREEGPFPPRIRPRVTCGFLTEERRERQAKEGNLRPAAAVK